MLVLAKPAGFVIAAAAGAASTCATIETLERGNEQAGANLPRCPPAAPITSVNASVMQKCLPAIRNNETDNVNASLVTLFMRRITGRCI